MKIYYTIDDLNTCIKFAVKYFLDETKIKSNRTTGQDRGLGAILNDFLVGKLIELGVKKAIDNAATNKKVELDFEIHTLNAENRNDPDIVGVEEIEPKFKRKPNVHIEIKNSSPTDRYTGLTQEQFQAIRTSSSVKGNLENIYLVYANLGTDNNANNPDPLGIYMKEKLPNIDLFEPFCEPGDIFIDIKQIITGAELHQHGLAFNAGSLFYETEIVGTPLNQKQVDKLEGKIEEAKFDDGKLPVIMETQMRAPVEFGDFIFEGEGRLFLKKNEKSKRVFLQTNENSIIKNKFLGDFILKKDNVYPIHFTTIGRDPVLKRNNFWIANRNLKNVTSKSVEERIKEIAERI